MKFHDEEKIFLKECLLEMGIKEKEAAQWLDDFCFTQSKETGKIGSCKYRIFGEHKSLLLKEVVIN